MTRPTDDQLQASLNDLSTAAASWQQMGEWLKSSAPDYGGHLADGLTFGLFVAVGMKYQAACLSLQKAAEVGGAKITEVGDALAEVKRQYEQDEANGVHLSQGKW